MQAHLRSTRLAPKKANLMAQMVRGLSVPDAMELLRNTSKKSARLFEGVLRSAIANAQHNYKQDPQTMVLKTVMVNKGMYYRRGTPMARGRVRPLQKFLCHITIELGYPEMPGVKTKVKKADKTASKAVKNPVQDAGSAPKAAPKAAAKPAAKKATKPSASSSKAS